MKADIRTEEDIKLLVDRFYTKVIDDKTLGYIFNDVAKVNWEKHLPIMYGFWSANLLGTTAYKGYLIDAHFKLNDKISLTEAHFNGWKLLFNETVNELFAGEVAELAKGRAKTIADLMLYKIITQAQTKKPE
ncbi:group III truncated hemoglobin [Pedobacter arcticus]|uniref:group III truncated hemoglobin n=1 Tax=Pedobacter arcticus TaxID=752140 RepID=UPI00030495FE|nr:group III truncated hemoglobin [Pedobacter arcticus]